MSNLPKRKVALLYPTRLPRIDNFLLGCEVHGYEVVHVPTHTPGEALDEFIQSVDFGVCSGTRQNTAAVRKRFRAKGKPVAIIDLGYLKRANDRADRDGYNQAGWDRLCWVPEGEQPPDRLFDLDLTILGEREPPEPDNHVLLAGQVAGDAQHNLEGFELTQWLLSEAEVRFPGRNLVYRPHPKDVSYPTLALRRLIRTECDVSLQEAIDAAGDVLTYNSTLGVDAMLRGVPVSSHKSAHYHGSAVKDLDTRLSYLRRLAYAQWNQSEFRDGSSLEFLLQHTPIY